jgi:hypothetical protein
MKAQIPARSYSSTISLASALDGRGRSRHVSAALAPGKRPGFECTGGWEGPRARPESYGKSRPLAGIDLAISYTDTIPD